MTRHVIFGARLCGWQGFGYRQFETNHRNWITTDFELRLGFIVVEGWLP